MRPHAERKEAPPERTQAPVHRAQQRGHAGTHHQGSIRNRGGFVLFAIEARSRKSDRPSEWVSYVLPPMTSVVYRFGDLPARVVRDRTLVLPGRVVRYAATLYPGSTTVFDEGLAAVRPCPARLLRRKSGAPSLDSSRWASASDFPNRAPCALLRLTTTLRLA